MTNYLNKEGYGHYEQIINSFETATLVGDIETVEHEVLVRGDGTIRETLTMGKGIGNWTEMVVG